MEKEYEAVLVLLKKHQHYFERVKEVNNLQSACLKYFSKVSSAPLLDRKSIHRNFLEELKLMKVDRFERKAFLYLDILYWLELKV